ncbi:MAG TPA: hypothetical protein VFR34_03090 [Paracoccaceae bacterium]|nr:hypothetical protein [Paracoccaceae bacterium]
MLRRRRDFAILLPLVGAFLFLPPFIHVFRADAALFGLPLIVVYLFGAWALLIALAFRLTRLLRAEYDKD